MPDQRFGTVRNNWGPSIKAPEPNSIPRPMAIDMIGTFRAPLVLTIGGIDGRVPDKLLWTHSDGTTSEHAIVDRARFERVMRFVRAYDNAPDPLWHNAGGLSEYGNEINEVQNALDAIQPGDLDPLP